MSPSTSKHLIGKWGRLIRDDGELQKISYTEFNLKPDGTFTFTGFSFAQPVEVHGTWSVNRGKVYFQGDNVLKGEDEYPHPRAFDSEMTLFRYPNSTRLNMQETMVHTWAHNVSWDFERRDYFDEEGDRLEFKN